MLFKACHKVVFFFTLLISVTYNGVRAQELQADSLKKPNTDSLALNANSNELDEKATYSADDSTVAMPQEGKAYLYGKSKIDYGSTNMQAEVIEANYGKNTVVAYGKRDSSGKLYGTPTFKEGAETMEAEKIMYNLKTKKGKIFNALTKQGELLVIGTEIKKDSNDVIYMRDMQCIPCQQKDSRTIFRATKAKIIPNDKIVTGPMYLEVGGVPTPLGLPFGFFPNTKKQHNGILLPTFGSSPGQGYFLKQGGYYLGINEKTDLTFRGDIYANGSWAANVTNNYRVLYKASGFVYFGYSHFNIGDRDIPKTFSQQTAYEIKWNHNQDNRNNPSVKFGANVNYVKNQSINRFGAANTGAFLQNNFLSNVIFTKNFKTGSLSVNGSHNLNSQTHQMTILLPSLTYNRNRFFPFRSLLGRENAPRQNVFDKIGVSYLLQLNNSLSGKEDTIFMGNVLDSMKYGLKHTIPISTNFNLFKYITVTPGANFSSVMYMNTIEKEFHVDTVNVDAAGNTKKYVSRISNNRNNGFTAAYEWNFTTSMTTKIFNDFIFRKGRLRQIRYLLIPTLGYTYRPDFGAAKYGYWKTVQTDTNGNRGYYSIFERSVFNGPSRGKLNALSINLNNNLEAKIKHETDTGVTYKKISILQNIGISTNYNLAADSFKMDMISLTGRTVLFKNININFNTTFDPYVYDHENNRAIDRYELTQGERLARFTRAQISINSELSDNMVEAAQKLLKPPSLTNGAERDAQESRSSTKPLPWSLRLGYNLILTNKDDSKIQPSHALTLVTNLSPTKFWKLGISTGYDFNAQKASYTSFNIYRDLKCWEANIAWVPFGINKSYRFTMNLKTAMLSEFKIPRQRQWYDNF